MPNQNLPSDAPSQLFSSSQGKVPEPIPVGGSTVKFPFPGTTSFNTDLVTFVQAVSKLSSALTVSPGGTTYLVLKDGSNSSLWYLYVSNGQLIFDPSPPP